MIHVSVPIRYSTSAPIGVMYKQNIGYACQFVHRVTALRPGNVYKRSVYHAPSLVPMKDKVILKSIDIEHACIVVESDSDGELVFFLTRNGIWRRAVDRTTKSVLAGHEHEELTTPLRNRISLPLVRDVSRYKYVQSASVPPAVPYIRGSPVPSTVPTPHTASKPVNGLKPYDAYPILTADDYMRLKRMQRAKEMAAGGQFNGV